MRPIFRPGYVSCGGGRKGWTRCRIAHSAHQPARILVPYTGVRSRTSVKDADEMVDALAVPDIDAPVVVPELVHEVVVGTHP